MKAKGRYNLKPNHYNKDNSLLTIIIRIVRYHQIIDTLYLQVGYRNTRKKLHCECNHLSSFVGLMKNFNSMPTNIIIVNHELELQFDYVTYLFVFIIFLLYCIIVAIGTTTHRKLFKKNKTIFLSDNVKTDRYAYLIVVITGSQHRAGTTSNICIQISGEKADSRVSINKSNVIQYKTLNFSIIFNFNKPSFL